MENLARMDRVLKVVGNVYHSTRIMVYNKKVSQESESVSYITLTPDDNLSFLRITVTEGRHTQSADIRADDPIALKEALGKRMNIT